VTHIDPKAPYDSAQHPHNWRAPVFLAPGGVVVDAPTPPVQQPPDVPVEAVSVPPAPKKTVAKKPPTRKKASDLAEALAKLSDR
jgi:hypothetical protein